MHALASQGKTTVVATPSLVAVNNEPAIVRTDAFAVSVTPQIGADGAIMLDVAPIVKAPAVAETEMLARVGRRRDARHRRLHPRPRGAGAKEPRHCGRLVRQWHRRDAQES